MFATAMPTPVLHAKSFWGSAPAVVLYQREPKRSELKVWLSKKGLLSAAGHNLVIKVHDWTSHMRISPDGECELEVEVQAKSLAVEGNWKPTKKLEAAIEGIAGQKVEVREMDSWSIREIHDRMHGKAVLEVAKYPTVTYKGRGKKCDKGFHFEGTMNLKGIDGALALNSELTVEADDSGRPYFVMKGETTFPMTKWGIKPVSVLMGSLQLKDEVTAKWEVHYVANAQ